jgi:hypothetical protein
MGVASSEATPAVPRRLSTAVAIGVIVLTLAFLVVGYVRAGWNRMEEVCTADPPGGQQVSSVAYGWSWSAPGFTCTYDNGRTRSSLWF